MFKTDRNPYSVQEQYGRIAWLMLAVAGFTASGLIVASAILMPYGPLESIQIPKSAVDLECVAAISPMGDAAGVAYFDDPLRWVGECQ